MEKNTLKHKVLFIFKQSLKAAVILSWSKNERRNLMLVKFLKVSYTCTGSQETTKKKPKQKTKKPSSTKTHKTEITSKNIIERTEHIHLCTCQTCQSK